VDTPEKNPYPSGEIDHLLYTKCWVDTVQWHLEDQIRNPDIEPEEGMRIKRRIDSSNQLRTDRVEQIDDYFLDRYKLVTVRENAGFNTESPAWALDRLSILALKIYHMRQELRRPDASAAHLEICGRKLGVLVQQREDLTRAIDDLLNDLAAGNRYMKVYRQMKMYNDPNLNPVLYQQASR
jgi:hypothetical protein